MDQTQSCSLRSKIEALFTRQVADFTGCAEFRDLEGGRAAPAQYDAFIENVARAHLKSPQLLAFLYATAPPEAVADLLHNLLEELGLEDAAGTSHPELLRQLVHAAGLGNRLPDLEARADDDIRRAVVEPLLYGTLRDVGLAALVEIVAFEFMLSRVSSRVARALATHRGLGPAALAWFTQHAEVDVRHAEQGFTSLHTYVRYYELADDAALTIIELTLRDNVFARRYFRDVVPTSTGTGAR